MPDQVILNLTNRINDSWYYYLNEVVTPQIDLGFTRVVIRLTGRYAGSTKATFRADDYPIAGWRQMAADLRGWRRKHPTLRELALYIGRPYHHSGRDALDNMHPLMAVTQVLRRARTVVGVVDRLEFDSLFGPEPELPNGSNRGVSKLSNLPHIMAMIDLLQASGFHVAGESRHAAKAPVNELNYSVLQGRIDTWDRRNPVTAPNRNRGLYAPDDEHFGEVAIAVSHKGGNSSGDAREEVRRLHADGMTARIFNTVWKRDVNFWNG